MRWLAWLLAAQAFAASLADLQATAEKLRAQRSEPPGWRGESPLLTEFKHQLRDWVESRMTGEIADPRSLQKELNRTLADAGFMCNGKVCDDQSELGYLGDLRLDRLTESTGWLVLRTGVGIACGVDESVYLYERIGDQWLRRFESEQNQYGQGYTPQGGIEVQSTLDSSGRRLVLTSGVNPACTSIWQTGYFRLFRSGELRPLLDREHTVNDGDDDHEIRLLPDDILLQFPAFVLHFKIEGDRLRRIEPIAVSPATFVDEWLASPWSEVGEWSDSSLAPWHARVNTPLRIYGFLDDVTACPKRPGQWQIVDEGDRQSLYFLVEERAPGSYRMLDVSITRQAGCEP